MIRAFSQLLCPPFSGQAQIVETDRARAMTMDGKNWDIHFVRTMGGMGESHKQKNSFFRAAYVTSEWIERMAAGDDSVTENVDDRILELTRYITHATLPFPKADQHEYWLLDRRDGSPLALIFSCMDLDQRETFPDRPEWTALPAAVAPIERTKEELANGDPPVNYQVERLIANRAGPRPIAKWFHRDVARIYDFPPLLIREDWENEHHHDLCQRYIERMSPRLLMLQGLEADNRARLEQAARPNAMEVGRFYSMYPDIVDEELMSSLRVEAHLRGLTEDEPEINHRRDGVLYL